MPLHASSCRVQLVFHTWTLVRAKLAALEPSLSSAVPSLNAAAGAVRASSGQKLLEEHPCAWQHYPPPPQDHLLRGVARLGAAGMEGTLAPCLALHRAACASLSALWVQVAGPAEQPPGALMDM